MPRSFYLLLGVQFLSTLGDNAFLILAIARVTELQGAEWLVPLLKISFTLFYVLLAPGVGPLADAFRKGRVMLAANTLKVLAMLVLLWLGQPLWAIGIAGLGNALYAPAKYGLITELLPPRQLVRANGYFESITVCGVILGTVLGGVLVSPLLTQSLHAFAPDPIHPTRLLSGMQLLLGMNLGAAVLSLWVVDSGARYARLSFHPLALLRQFFAENRTLWADRLGGLSMAVTTLLWGVGATLQLIVLRWAQESLGLPLAQAAYLQGVTALGVIAGAWLASRHVRLERAQHLLPLGLVLGAGSALLLGVAQLYQALLLLVVIGALAGFFVVPMNALLQHRGCTLLTAGRSIAVQGFNENAGMLLMLGVYALATGLDCPLPWLVGGFAAFVSGGMALVMLSRR